MLKENLDKIFSVIKNGNNLGEKITLVGASKTMPLDVINQAISLGLEVVAENKVQEFNAKHGEIIGAREHFIGHLQTNKVKYLVGKVELIQSVDSIHLAQAIDKEALKKSVVQNVLIEINVGGELSKSGFDFENAFNSVIEIDKQFKNIHVIGLMAMLPRTDDEKVLTNCCDKMRTIFDSLKQNGVDMVYLSMGMSQDYKLAINHGSNMIRLGRDIFGERNYNEVK